MEKNFINTLGLHVYLKVLRVSESGDMAYWIHIYIYIC